MPEIRAIISLVLRISFVVLIGVLMILWIVIGVQAVNEVKQLETQNTRNNNNRNQFSTYDKRTLERVKGMTIFNAILDEVIALVAILGVILSHRYLLQTSMTLLAIIWFVAHYRITEYIWYGSPTMIAAHIIHFFVVCIGLSFVNFLKEPVKSREKTSKIRDQNNGTKA